MAETRAYLTHEDGEQLRVTVHRNATLYSKGDADQTQSWTFPLTDDGKDYVMGAEPEQPYVDADRVLGEHGWTREGPWAVGDVVTGTYATITRASAKHVLQGTDPIRARHLRGGMAKLVRDKIPGIIRATGEDPVVHVAGDEDYRQLLQAKLGEEVGEFLEAPTDIDALEELADVLEVVRALAADLGATPEKLEAVRQAKAEQRGGFNDRIVWTGNR